MASTTPASASPLLIGASFANDCGSPRLIGIPRLRGRSYDPGQRRVKQPAGNSGCGRPLRADSVVACCSTRGNLPDLARGCAVLGTGGGGDPETGLLMSL